MQADDLQARGGAATPEAPEGSAVEPRPSGSNSSAATSPDAANIYKLLVGRTIKALTVKSYSSGYGGAIEALDITTDEGVTVTLYAGYYAIPEEACIYATHDAPARRSDV